MHNRNAPEKKSARNSLSADELQLSASILFFVIRGWKRFHGLNFLVEEILSGHFLQSHTQLRPVTPVATQSLSRSTKRLQRFTDKNYFRVTKTHCVGRTQNVKNRRSILFSTMSEASRGLLIEQFICDWKIYKNVWHLHRTKEKIVYNFVYIFQTRSLVACFFPSRLLLPVNMWANFKELRIRHLKLWCCQRFTVCQLHRLSVAVSYAKCTGAVQDSSAVLSMTECKHQCEIKVLRERSRTNTGAQHAANESESEAELLHLASSGDFANAKLQPTQEQNIRKKC